MLFVILVFIFEGVFLKMIYFVGFNLRVVVFMMYGLGWGLFCEILFVVIRWEVLGRERVVMVLVVYVLVVEINDRLIFVGIGENG